MMALMERSRKSPTSRHPLKSVDPSYKEVAKKYAKAPATRDILVKKNFAGGQGSWGIVPVPPHPQHNAEEGQQIVDAISGKRKET